MIYHLGNNIRTGRPWHLLFLTFQNVHQYVFEVAPFKILLLSDAPVICHAILPRKRFVTVLFCLFLAVLSGSDAALPDVGSCTFMEYFCSARNCLTVFVKGNQKDPLGNCR